MADRLAELVDVRLASAGVALVAGQRRFAVALQWEALAQPVPMATVPMATADIHKGIQARREHRLDEQLAACTGQKGRTA